MFLPLHIATAGLLLGAPVPPRPAADTIPDKVFVELRTALRRLVGVEENYYPAHNAYGTDIDASGIVTDNVKLQVTWAGPRGWIAQATTAAHPDISCVMFSGWIPESAWLTTRKQKRTADSGEAVCDKNGPPPDAPGDTWKSYATKLVTKVVGRVAAYEHSYAQKNGEFTSRVDSVVTKASGNEVRFTVAWATRDSWAGTATMVNSPRLACVYWEGPSSAPPKPLKLPSGKPAGPSGATTCE